MVFTPTLILALIGCGENATAPESGADTSQSAIDTSEPGDTPSEDVAGTPAVVPLEPPPADQGFQIAMYATAPAFSEVWVCEVKPFPIEGIANVNWVEVQQNPGTHHLTLSTLGFASAGKVPHGTYDCNELYGESSLMEDQIMFFGNQGSAEDLLQLPKGVAATIPSGLDVIHEIHYVNASTEPVELYSRVNAWTIPQEELVSGIWGGSVRDEHINIPANSKHSEWTRCVMNRDVEVLFLASHTHEMGVEFTIAPYDGKTTGEVFYTNDDWHTPKIVQYDPPIVLKKGEGFEWACTWDNPTDKEVNYGPTSEHEMCNLAIVHTPFDTEALCEVVESSDGVLWKP